MRYRRALVPGGTWFFTLVTAERSKIFETEDNIAILRNAFRSVRNKHPFEIDAIVDYVHYNPVKHGYVDDPASWPWSSIRRFIRLGLLPQDWGQYTPDLPDGIGFE